MSPHCGWVGGLPSWLGLKQSSWKRKQPQVHKLAQIYCVPAQFGEVLSTCRSQQSSLQTQPRNDTAGWGVFPAETISKQAKKLYWSGVAISTPWLQWESSSSKVCTFTAHLSLGFGFFLQRGSCNAIPQQGQRMKGWAGSEVVVCL